MDWGTRVVSVPQSYLTLVQSVPAEIYELPLNQFRLDLKGLEASEYGMCFPNTHNHNTEVLLGGIVYARIIEMINNYTVTFEDLQYRVNLIGANSNVSDVTNVNQVGINTQNSAGLISNSAIEFSSFNGGVTIDLNNTTGFAGTGTVFPAGTRQQPCSLLSDAALIATRRGFSKIYVLGNATLDDAADWHGFEFEGESALKTTITILDIANVVNSEFYDCNVTGMLDGNSQIERAVVNALDFVDGYIYSCAIGDIKLGTFTNANIFSCFSTVPGTSTPTIDMNGTGVLALRDYSGGALLTNYNGTDSHSIDLSSGQIKLDTATITSGTFIVRGVGKLIDELGNSIPTGTWNGGVTIVNELINTKNLVDSTWAAQFGDHFLVGSMGWVMNDMLRNIGYDITSEEVLGETHITIWEDTAHTIIYRVYNIGTVDIPKRVDITP